ncbi:MAG: 50S ribosomal protein L19e [archaeon]
MKSKIQKNLAAKITGKSRKKVILDSSRLDEIKEAITRSDVRALIKDSAIIVKQDKGVSRVRARKSHIQKTRGRRRGQGSRKGGSNARLELKRRWINKVRLQRKLLKSLKENSKVTPEVYKDLYRKSKGGFFRSKRHIMLYVKEHKLMK